MMPTELEASCVLKRSLAGLVPRSGAPIHRLTPSPRPWTQGDGAAQPSLARGVRSVFTTKARPGRGERPLWDERSPLAREGEAGARCGMNASAGRQRLRSGFMLQPPPYSCGQAAAQPAVLLKLKSGITPVAARCQRTLQHSWRCPDG
jgi:hypothetical protein